MAFAFSNQATDFLERNHSYVYNITIRPSVLYLFSDGTVGTIGDKGSRIPIAVVVKEKTSASDKGLAVALTPAGNGMVVSKKVCKLDIILIFALSNKKQQEYGTYTRTNFGNYFELHK